jgi:drug/metabolite transporter superfamily protein YnfA
MVDRAGHDRAGAVRVPAHPCRCRCCGAAYAAYGGVYIVASLLWLWLVENCAPDRWDMIGATMCIVGAGVILLAPRSCFMMEE